jgi:hypothetical protein
VVALSSTADKSIQPEITTSLLIQVVKDYQSLFHGRDTITVAHGRRAIIFQRFGYIFPIHLGQYQFDCDFDKKNKREDT